MRTLIVGALLLAGVAAGLAWQLDDNAPSSAPLHLAGGTVPSPAAAAQAVAGSVQCAPVLMARWSLLSIELDAGGRPARAQLWAPGQPPRMLAAGQLLDGPLRVGRVAADGVEIACDGIRRELHLAGAVAGASDGTPPLHTALAAPNGN